MQPQPSFLSRAGCSGVSQVLPSRSSALLLCLALCLSVAAGCADESTGSTVSQDQETSDAGRTDTEGQEDVSTPEPDAADSGSIEDSGTGADATAEDVGTVDSGNDGGTDPMECDFVDLGSEDRDRVVIISHPFLPEGSGGTSIQGLTLTSAGELQANGDRVDLGVRAARIVFAPSGELAFVVGADGELLSLAVDGADSIEVVDRIMLPPAGYKDIVLLNDGMRLAVVGGNSSADGGISMVNVACDGTLSADPDAFHAVRLADSLVPFPDQKSRALLVGGQALFEPQDVYDIRILDLDGPAPSEVAAFDVFDDYLTTGKAAVSPDGNLALVPNSSAFSSEGGHLAMLEVSSDRSSLTHLGSLMELHDVAEVGFSPDGGSAIATQGEPGKVVVLNRDADGVYVRDVISSIGLAVQFSIIERGPQTGLILVPSVDANGGPNIATLRFEADGSVSDEGQFELGGGGEMIPEAIAVQP